MKPVDGWEWLGIVLVAGGLVAPFVIYFGGIGEGAKRWPADCHVDWDGRSNPDIC
jgi:hypothetical protein